MFRFGRKTKFKRLQNTLMFAFLTLSLIPLTIIAFFFLESHTQDLEEQSRTHLLSVRDSAVQQVDDHIANIESQVTGFVRSELAYASGGRFYGLISAFHSLGSDLEEAQTNAQNRYIQGSSDKVRTSILPESEEFIGSERYRLLHQRYHSTYVELINRSLFDDLLLVDLKGNVTYSVKKGAEFGTNLLTGSFQKTNLGQTFYKLKFELDAQHQHKPNYTPVFYSDFNMEESRRVAWVAAPIIKQGYLHSYAMFRVPSSVLSDIIQNSATPDISAILVGEDLNSRTLSTSEIKGSDSEFVINKALAGYRSVESYTNKNGEDLIAAYAPIKLDNLTWALVVELPESVAFARIYNLEKLFIGVMLGAIILVFIASHYLSNFITSPLLKLTWAAEKVSAGDLDENVINTERKDEIGRLAVSFERMQRSIREKIQLIRSQNEELEKNLKLIQKQNDELQLASKLKDEFLATTSHELRTPLHGMVGIAEALISGANGQLSASQKYQLEIIVSSGQRLSTLVDDLLDYHKMRYGNMDIEHVAVNLEASTKLVLELSNHLVGTKPIRIINQVSDDIPLVSADPQKIEQVLYNLIGNAIKYTSEGKIVISATALDDILRVQVVDTGQGIPAEDLEQIFEPLIQASKGSGRYRQGAGLGLSISRQLIELMGGTLYVSSQPQVGTTFSFTLPLASEEEKQHLTHPALKNHYDAPRQESIDVNYETQDLPDNPDSDTILVVDDEPVNLQVLNSFLRLEGFNVKLAASGMEALNIIDEAPPKLVLLDVMMPEMNGYDVCRKLRNDYDRAQLPIVMLTALSQPEDKVRGFEAGANDYLPKPFNKQELYARITAHLNASEAEMQRAKNSQLRAELHQRELVEASLLETQGRLLEQLETAPEAIICINNEDKIKFANDAATRLFKRTHEQLRRSIADEIIAHKFLSIKQAHAVGEVDIFIDDSRHHISADILQLPEGSGLKGMFIFDNGSGADTARIQNLETAVEALSNYAFEGDKNQLQTLKELGGEFTRIADKMGGETTDKQTLMRHVLVETMISAIDYWESVSGQSKFDFAENSGLWRVYLDRSTLQTRTLDKYLRVETLPKTPRWRTVLNSADYILEHCIADTPQRNHLMTLREKLQKLLTS
jgi:two-component system sensor histidine kinase ChiS